MERIEIVKGPASSFYGSEAVGCLINIITKNPKNVPLFSADTFTTHYGELNVVIGFKANIGKTTLWFWSIDLGQKNKQTVLILLFLIMSTAWGSAQLKTHSFEKVEQLSKENQKPIVVFIHTC